MSSGKFFSIYFLNQKSLILVFNFIIFLNLWYTQSKSHNEVTQRLYPSVQIFICKLKSYQHAHFSPSFFFSKKEKKKNLSHVKSEKIYDFGEFIKHLARSGVIVGTNQCWLNKDMQELLHTWCFCPSKGHWRGHAILSCLVHPEKNQFNWSSRHQFLLLTWYILKYLFGSLFQESWPLPAFPK